jgi:hypothetical protein
MLFATSHSGGLGLRFMEVEHLLRNHICPLDPLSTQMDFDGQIFALQ